IDQEHVGGGPHALYDQFLNQALGHIDEWYVDRLWEQPGNVPYQPHKVGMTMQALIQAHAHRPDSRILTKMQLALDNLWAIAWRVDDQAFYLSSDSPDQGDPNFNLLIAPAYAWYYNQTGETVYRDVADQIFAGGVTRASLATPLQFNQNYMWSFDYVIWRQADPQVTPPPAPEPTPAPPPAPPSNNPPVCSGAHPQPESLWPPNHRMVQVDIVGVTDPNGDPVTLIATGIMQDEPVNGKGDGHTRIDAVLQGRTVALRAERSRHGDGRVYEVAFSATDSKGGACTGTVKVSVPVHKKKVEAIDSGALYDSLGEGPKHKKGHWHEKDKKKEKKKEMERIKKAMKRIKEKVEKAAQKRSKKQDDRDD
ncbi:MAG: hypothetical protein ACREI3_10045, partial [Nitrospirales bacterium]